MRGETAFMKWRRTPKTTKSFSKKNHEWGNPVPDIAAVYLALVDEKNRF